MSPVLNTFLAVVFLITGAGAGAVMLELKGQSRDRIAGAALIRLHRILGYTFVALFSIMVVAMIRKAGAYQEEFSVRVVLHAALGLVLIPLVAAKIFIARRLRNLTDHLPLLGVILFSLAFVLNGLTAGHYLLHRTDPRYVTVSDIDQPVLNTDIGRLVLFDKCGKCHTFERVFRATKDQDGWTRTVNRMAVIDAPNINQFDVKQVIFFLLEQQKLRQKKLGRIQAEQIGQTLVSQKCTRCHDLERVFKASKTESQWQQTLEKMVNYAGDPEYLALKEKKDIAAYLSGDRTTAPD
jgi:cytochrome c2